MPFTLSSTPRRPTVPVAVSCRVRSSVEAANYLVEALQRRGVHRAGAITLEQLETVVSDAAARGEEVTPGASGDALVWEELEERAL